MSDFVRDLEAELLAAARRRTARARRWSRTPAARTARRGGRRGGADRRRAHAARQRSVRFRRAGPGAVLHRLPRRQPAAARRALYLQPVWTMMIRAALTLLAVAGAGATFAACGGVPGNAVATVDGEAIEKEDFSHWMAVTAKAAGAQNTAVPDPEDDYAKCVAAKRKATPAPAKGQPKVTDEQLKTQCKTEYEQLRNQVLQQLISLQWIQGEADAMGIKVTDAEVKKSFEEQKKQSFPEGRRLPEVPQGLRPDPGGHPRARQARAADEQDPRQGRQGQGPGLREGDRGLLREEQGAVRPAGEARSAGGADQDQGQRRQGARRARRRRFVEEP